MIWQRPKACMSGNCPEVAFDGGVVHLRSTTRPEIITWSRAEWAAHKAAVIGGDYEETAP